VIVGDGQTLSDDGMVVSNLTVTGTINGEVVVNSTKYIATISQAGTAAPTVTVLENSIGDIVWSRTAIGRYQGTLTGAFPDQDKTYLIISNTAIDTYLRIFWVSANVVEVRTLDFTNTLQDARLSYNTIEIRTY
jgi:hypothetical protein